MEDELYTTWSPRLLRFARQMLRHAHDAEEMVQDVFTKLLQRDGCYALDESPGVLLFRLLRNRCIDHLRRKQSTPVEPAGARTVEPLARAPNRDLEEALASLSVPEREVVLLTVQDGLGYRDVAKILGCSLGTVAARKYAAVAKLQRRLSP